MAVALSCCDTVIVALQLACGSIAPSHWLALAATSPALLSFKFHDTVPLILSYCRAACGTSH